MLETKSIEELVQQQITAVVNQYVADAISTTDWMDAIESNIARFVQDRIAAKFANLNDLPELIQAVEDSVERLFDEGRIPGVGEYVDQQKLSNSIDSAIQTLVQSTLDNLVLDPKWVKKIESMVNQTMAARVSDQISGIDINAIIVDHIDSGIERWSERIIRETRTLGISDIASKTKLTVMDDAVAVDGGLATHSLFVETDAEIQGSVTMRDLVVKGTINTDNQSWKELTDTIAERAATATHQSLTDQWRQDLVDEVLMLAKHRGIEFDNIKLDGESLVNGTKLNSKIVDTKIEALGVLRDLRVAGDTHLTNDTLNITPRRVGINTTEPEMALSVWDEEVSILSGKFAKNVAYVGTGRKQGLALGVNRVPQIQIDEEGLTTIKQLRLDRFRIGHATQVPGYSGTRGDLMINSDPKPDTPFAWQCLGGFQWQPIWTNK